MPTHMNAIVPIGEAAGGQTASHDAADAAAELAALRAIVDDLETGIVVLDKDRRVQFVNRAFRRFWRVPDEVADSRQTFVKLMYLGRGINAYAVSPDQLGDYVAKQLALIRTGDGRPLSFRLANGEAIHCRCKTLPDGGRLLIYGNVGALADEAETIERLVWVDGLTGLNNRRHFLTLAEGEWSRFRRYGRPLALMMIDIDLFKSVNDTYGHDAGDQVVKTVAEVLLTYKRTSDLAGRLGGEEFALMLLEATLDNAIVVAERLRQLIAERAIVVAGQRIAVTVSIGASVSRADMDGFDELLKEADIALYEATRSGGNRVCRFAPDQPREIQAAPASDCALAASNERESTFK
jgi:diguanylate cyclase (GGDEF)-like protein